MTPEPENPRRLKQRVKNGEEVAQGDDLRVCIDRAVDRAYAISPLDFPTT
jgi:hypothetical protein